MAASTAPSRLTPRFALAVDGSRIAHEDAHAVLRVVVDEAPDRLDAFEILVAPDDGPGGLDDRFQLGSEVTIEVGHEDSPSMQPLIEGDVTALEPSFPEGGPARLRVRGHDRLHRLRRGRRTRAFQEVSDADVVRQIAAELGLEARVDDTGPPRGHTFQRNCSDADLLGELARRNGFLVRVHGRTLEFVRPARTSPAATTLRWGEDLIACELRWSTHDLVTRVEVRGWDYRRKQAVVGIATAQQVDRMEGRETAADVADRAHGGATLVLVDARAGTQDEANQVARAELEARSARFGSGSAITRGNPDLRSGQTVRLEGVGAFGGAWFVVATRHVVDPRSGYRTHLELARNSRD